MRPQNSMCPQNSMRPQNSMHPRDVSLSLQNSLYCRRDSAGNTIAAKTKPNAKINPIKRLLDKQKYFDERNLEDNLDNTARINLNSIQGNLGSREKTDNFDNGNHQIRNCECFVSRGYWGVFNTKFQNDEKTSVGFCESSSSVPYAMSVSKLTTNWPLGTKKTQDTSGASEENVADVTTKRLSGRPYQVALTIMTAFTTMVAGSAVAFPSVIIPDVQEEGTNIYGAAMAFTDIEKDLIGSLTSAGAFVGIAVSAALNRRLGKLTTLRLVMLLGVVSWLGVAAAPTTWVVLVMRVLNGAVNGGVCATSLAYVVEIADDVTRGPLTLVASISLFLGQSLSVMPAYWLRYYGVALVNCVYPAIFIVFATFCMPPSPSALVIQGNKTLAREILLRLRVRGSDVDAEIDSYERLNETFQNVKLSEALFRSDVIKNLAIVFALFLIQVSSGYALFTVQTARFLQDSGSTIDLTTGTIIVQSAQIFGVVLAMLSVRRLGRRGEMLLSQGMTGLSLGALAVYVHLFPTAGAFYPPLGGYRNSSSLTLEGNITESEVLTKASQALEDREAPAHGWVPLLCLTFAQMSCSFGLQNIPNILSSEYFPTAIRPQASSICFMMAAAMRVIQLQLYSPMRATITHLGLLVLCSASCLLSLPLEVCWCSAVPPASSRCLLASSASGRR
ncbi:facilitated trehalose transporter Tret1 [Hyalella azteca]|uniref:Facilitated trehalose transporter Tret1 n=1 Tax=Hyalella azteca TaxID=294128 RepID=A0A8B7P7P4_HYAAZ|nr:facilitated trehalose transporter Tret1 [Hyalella azteca]